MVSMVEKMPPWHNKQAQSWPSILFRVTNTKAQNLDNSSITQHHTILLCDVEFVHLCILQSASSSDKTLCGKLIHTDAKAIESLVNFSQKYCTLLISKMILF
uniref:Uncharacterized protein n=1 Tax=Eutreptiella gymnastica TaxID=73025 RepID=A0A7S1NG51_9EUGL